MHLANERKRDRAFGQRLRRQRQGFAVIHHFLNVGDLFAAELHASFIFQHFIDRRLRAFDFRRQHRFVGGQRRKQDGRVDDPLQQSVIAGQGRIGGSVLADDARIVEVFQRQGAGAIGLHSRRLRFFGDDAAHVDFTGDGGGDRGGAAFLQKGDSSFGLPDKMINSNRCLLNK